jgi:hypothetical protein
MYIYIGAVSFNLETTLYFLKFNNLFVFSLAFVYAPLIGWSMLYRYYSVQNRRRLHTDGERARAHRTYLTFFVLSTRRD